jgi:hypothetical protein
VVVGLDVAGTGLGVVVGGNSGLLKHHTFGRLRPK